MGQQSLPLPDLARALERREVQAVIGALLNPQTVRWIKNLQVPLSLLYGNNRVTDMSAQRKALEWMAANGCRTVGMIVHSTSDELYPMFEGHVRAVGMQTDRIWVKQNIVKTESVNAERGGV